MKPLSHYKGTPIEWRQPSFFKRTFEATAGEEKIFSLQFSSLFKLEAVAESFGKVWRFKNTKFFSNDVDIREEGFELPFAKYSTSIWKMSGTIELPRGERLQCNYGMWKGIYTVSTESELNLLTFERRFGFKEKGIVTLLEYHPTIDAHPWIPALILFIDIQRRAKSSS